MKRSILCLLLVPITVLLSGQDMRIRDGQAEYINVRELKNEIYTNPSVFFHDGFLLIYGRSISNRSDITIGYRHREQTSTLARELSYPGDVTTNSIQLGYRLYLWRGLHMENQLMPGSVSYFEDASGFETKGFELYNEIRAGYQLNLTLGKIPVLLNFQWPLGFRLHKTNEPASFEAVSDEDPLYYRSLPNVYLGLYF